MLLKYKLIDRQSSALLIHPIIQFSNIFNYSTRLLKFTFLVKILIQLKLVLLRLLFDNINI